MSRLSKSVTSVLRILGGADLGADYTVSQLLDETTARRSLDLSDLSPQEQAALVEGRAINLIPSAAVLAEKIEAARSDGRRFVIKYGIDPTSPDVHLGHAVPIIIASRLQRMGHHVVFIIGDVTAKIGLQAVLRGHAEPPRRIPEGARRGRPRGPDQPHAGLRPQHLRCAPCSSAEGPASYP